MILYASRKFEDLHPYVAKLARAFVIECEAQGRQVLITSTFRSTDSIRTHDAHIARKSGIKPTNAKSHEYFHAYRVAFDFVPIYQGKCQWDDVQFFYDCGKIAEQMGLEWGGRWDEPDLDYEHCQFTDGLTLIDFKAGKTLPALYE